RAPIKGADPQLIWLSTLARSHGYPIRTPPSLQPTPIRTSVFARMNDTPLRTRLQLYRMMYLIRRTEEILMAEYHPADEMRCPMHFCVCHAAIPPALAPILLPHTSLISH